MRAGSLDTSHLRARWLRVRAGTDLGEAQEGVEVAHRAVEHGEEQDGERGEHDIEGGGRNVIHHGLAGEAAVELVVEEHEAKCDVLVEGVLDQT